MNLSYEVVEADFDSLVLARSHEVPVVLDIGAEWCSPCRVLTPLLERLVGGYGGKFVLAKVDADENMRIAGRHQAKGFPTVIAYSRGVVMERFHGAQTEGFLRGFLDRLVDEHARQGAVLAPAPEPVDTVFVLTADVASLAPAAPAPDASSCASAPPRSTARPPTAPSPSTTPAAWNAGPAWPSRRPAR